MSRKGNNMLLTVTGYASRTIRCIPCCSTEQKPLSAEATAKLYFEHIFRYHGLPNVLRTDRGSQFVGYMFREIFKLCGTRQAFG